MPRLYVYLVLAYLCFTPLFISGQAGINQLGGVFVNGRPLPDIIRNMTDLFFFCMPQAAYLRLIKWFVSKLFFSDYNRFEKNIEFNY